MTPPATSPEPFRSVTSRVVPLPLDHVDTDQIVPARFLTVTDRSGLREALFADWRQGSEPFVLDQPESEGAQILLVGENFGCGSSREHAPWALVAAGFRAIVGVSFADIFGGNALKNGLVPAALPAPLVAQLQEARAREPGLTLTVDLERAVVVLPDGEAVPFQIDPFAQHLLVEGIDELGYLMGHVSTIDAFEATHGVP